MNNFTSLHELFSMYRRELGYSFISCLVAVARHWQARDPFREVVTNGLLCAVVAFGISNLLEYFGIDATKWGYMGSVLLGYVGVSVLFDVVASRIPFLKSATTAARSNNDVSTK